MEDNEMHTNQKRNSKGLLTNFTMKWKLFAGFFIVFLFLLASVGTSIWGIKSISNQVMLYSKYTYPLTRYNLTAQREMTSCQRYMLMAILQKELGENYEESLTLGRSKCRELSNKL